MQGIPPAKDTDAEDVAWGLQTADAMWKRGERGDALVWLRRAVQAAADASDDDRALELARHAAELAETMTATASSPSSGAPGPAPRESVVPVVATTSNAPGSIPPPPPFLGEVSGSSKPPVAGGPRLSRPPLPRPRGSKPPANEEVRAKPPAPEAPSQPTVQTAKPQLRGEPDDEQSISVLPAERVHAGMFNPWDENSAPPSTPKPVQQPAPAPSASPSRFSEEEDEVITSASLAALRRSSRPDAMLTEGLGPEPARAGSPVDPPRRAAPSTRPKPPPLPPRAKKPEPPTEVAREALAPPPPVPPRPAQPSSPPQVATRPSTRVTRTEPDEVEVSVPPASPAKPPLDLDDVEAFADLPDDARAAFAAAATVSRLAEGEEVSHFALAYVLEGSLDVAATMVDAPASRLAAGAVLRARGTTDEGVPMRLICAGNESVVATWSDQAVEEAFRTCPWVEDDLRAAADKVLTLVGITIGPLGERLDASLREQIVARLTVRPLSAGEVVVNRGEAVPGLFLVGVGELELVDGGAVKGTIGSGEFLFAGEVLGAGAAPSTVRAGAGGALVLYGDRNVAQELMVTCPPLLEVFAGM